MAPSRRRLGVILKLVVAAYVVALAAMPFAHHDFVCHLKSSTHCATCHVGTSDDQDCTAPTLGAADFADAGQASVESAIHLIAGAASPSAGRAPPTGRSI